MNTPKLPRRSFILALSLFGAVQSFTGGAHAQSPSGDLTVTVQELENNEVRFTVAGSAPMKREGGFSSTSYDQTAKTPPHALGAWNQSALPAGLQLTAAAFTYDLNYVYFSSSDYWFLGTFSSNTLPINTPVNGSGSVTTDTIPFSNFVRGTYVVISDDYDITYRVRSLNDLTPARLTVQKPARFPATRVGRRSKPQTVRITNAGGTAATGVSVKTSGAGAKDFLLTKPASTIAAGGSSAFKATFKPRAKGTRRANATVSASNAAAASVNLIGKGQ